MADMSEDLTQAGMARLNQSIKDFVYCILRAQVNVRSSILGSSGSAKEVLRKHNNEAKGKIDLALSPGTWHMP